MRRPVIIARCLARCLTVMLAGAGVLVAAASVSSQRPARQDAAPATIPLAGELTQGGWARGRLPAGAAGLALDGKPVAIAADGSFFIAFDRDAGPAASLTLRLAGGRAVTQTVAVAPRAWKLEYIPLGPRPGTPPSEAFRQRRAAELARIASARAIDSGSQGWRQHFIWPAKGRVSGLFGSQRIYNGTPGSYHSGTDIATGASGTPILAPADGVVVLAAVSPFSLEGNLLMIDHGMGLNSAYLHCSQLLVHEGEAVRQGQLIARIGMTGRATGPHLHWSIKWRDARLDPMLFAGPMR